MAFPARWVNTSLKDYSNWKKNKWSTQGKRQLWLHWPNFPFFSPCTHAFLRIKKVDFMHKLNGVFPLLLSSNLSVLRSFLLKTLVFEPNILIKLSKIYDFLSKLHSALWKHFCFTEKLQGWAFPPPPKYFFFCDLNFREKSRRVAVHQSDPTLAFLRDGELALQSHLTRQVGSVLITNRLTEQSPSYGGIWRWLRLPWHQSKRQLFASPKFPLLL